MNIMKKNLLIILLSFFSNSLMPMDNEPINLEQVLVSDAVLEDPSNIQNIAHVPVAIQAAEVPRRNRFCNCHCNTRGFCLGCFIITFSVSVVTFGYSLLYYCYLRGKEDQRIINEKLF